MKIVINNCYGGFGLSTEAAKKLGIVVGAPEHTTEREWNAFGIGDISRNDPRLVAVVEEMGKAANGEYSELAVVEIPDGVDWVIEEYDGKEWIAERHRSWGAEDWDADD